MLNIFNLFLFLMSLWVIFLIGFVKISQFYLIFGLILCFSLSFLAFRLKFIEKNSQMIYLHLSFYSHFVKILIIGFFKIWPLLFSIFLIKKEIKPIIYRVQIDKTKKFNEFLLNLSINIFPGLSMIDKESDFVTIYAIDEKYFKDLNLSKMIKNLSQINEDEIV